MYFKRYVFANTCMYFGWYVFVCFLECMFFGRYVFVCFERYVLCFLCFSGKYAFYFDSYEACFSNYQNRWGPCNCCSEVPKNMCAIKKFQKIQKKGFLIKKNQKISKTDFLNVSNKHVSKEKIFYFSQTQNFRKFAIF